MSKHNFRRVSGTAAMLHCAAERRIGPFWRRPKKVNPVPVTPKEKPESEAD